MTATSSEPRFEFGSNWTNFSVGLTDRAIEDATASVQDILGVCDLKGKSFLDVGSGSGLFSLAARKLGARVHSFDYDPKSVSCTAELKRRYFSGDEQWIVEQGSALDRDYLVRLGQFDIVYSWGVLHHTGAMWDAISSVMPMVAPDGKLCIAIYNDQRSITRYWTKVKRLYCSRPWLRPVLIAAHAPYLGARAIARTVAGRGRLERGMSLWHDYLDWLGGYPFEAATPEQIFEFVSQQGFVLRKMKTCGGRMGCNEFMFERTHQPESSK
ncbi:MAG TPA: class I SAM-dependent methyltransferase [Sphingomicrobium sp.]|nr:class I SAM-dependent methyltransferase [Sphingomicrobium sp.]